VILITLYIVLVLVASPSTGFLVTFLWMIPPLKGQGRGRPWLWATLATRRSAYPWRTIQMVIITAAINNPAPSHAISLLGAVGDLARARVGTTFLRIDFTCTPKIVEGPASSTATWPALRQAE
jgi:hypothetical protein